METPHPAVFICIHTFPAVTLLRDYVFRTRAVWLLVRLLAHKLTLAELSPPGAVLLPLTNSGPVIAATDEQRTRHFDW